MFLSDQWVDPVLRFRPLAESSTGQRRPQVIVNILHRVAAAPAIPLMDGPSSSAHPTLKAHHLEDGGAKPGAQSLKYSHESTSSRTA